MYPIQISLIADDRDLQKRLTECNRSIWRLMKKVSGKKSDRLIKKWWHNQKHGHVIDSIPLKPLVGIRGEEGAEPSMSTL